MSRAQQFEHTDLEDLRKGDRVIALRDTSYLPSDLHVETFNRVELQGGGRLKVVLKDKGSVHDLFVDPLDTGRWRFYRKVKR